MWKCPNCDTKNEEKDQFCSCCGEKRIIVKTDGSAQKSVEKEYHNRQQYHQNIDSSNPEYSSGNSSTQSSRTADTQKKTENSNSAAHTKQKRNARMLALVISIVLVLLQYWELTAIEGTGIDFTNKNALLILAAPFVCTAAVFYGKSIPLMVIASIILGFFALFEVFLFAFCITGGTISTVGIWICIIVGVVTAFRAGKTIIQGADNKNT